MGIYILSGAVLILAFLVFRISSKLKSIRDDLEKTQHETVILKSRLTQIENIDLDFTVIENQMEENTQQLVSFVREGVGEANRKVRYLEERVERVEELVDDGAEKLEDIERTIENMVDDEEDEKVG